MATTEFDSALEQRLRVLDQRMSALEYANVIRFERAELRREVRSLSLEDGCATVAELLTTMPRAIRTAKIGNLLLWPRGIHVRRILRWMEAAGCRDSLKVEKLTTRQRAKLIYSLRA